LSKVQNKVKNPELGWANNNYGVNSIVHAYLFGDGTQSVNLGTGGAGLVIGASEGITDTRIHTRGLGYNFSDVYYVNSLYAPMIETLLLDSSSSYPVGGNTKLGGNSFDIQLMINGTIKNSVFLQNHRENIKVILLIPRWLPWLYDNPNDASSDSPITKNAFLSKYWDPDINHWMRFVSSFSRDRYAGLARNYWGTTSSEIVDASIYDNNDNFNVGTVVYQPLLTTPVTTTYPFVVDVLLSTASYTNVSALHGPTPIVGAEPVTFTVTFNRDMDTSVQPSVSFGPDVPNTDYTIHPIGGGWTDPRTWVGTFNITPVTGDG